ncbi:hypothetical protein DRO31_00780 [Candidatus Bathyarchaeota archaeon]|nr:MAG: hypothetical protein DRO31_00780 [Candidatus Bathyarchaeota archaeon]HHL41162.1 hypothetical protein [Candidatus Bathyarchaeota archaeon]
MSVWEKLTSLPREVVMGLVIIAMLIPALSPLGLPLMTGQMSQDWYDTIEALPEGSVILFDIGYGSGGYPSLGPGTIAAFHQIFENDLKLVIMATALEGTLMYPLVMAAVQPESNYGAVYGEDYVFIGYIAGTQTAMAGVLGDLHELVTNDYQGNPISGMPLMDNVGGADDFAIVAYVTTSGDVAEGWVYQAYSQYNRDVLGGTLSMMTTSIKPYYDSGQLLGIMDGVKGAADLEFLTGHPGDAIVSSDILTFTQTLVLIFIAVGNISWFMQKQEGSG